MQRFDACVAVSDEELDQLVSFPSFPELSLVSFHRRRHSDVISLQLCHSVRVRVAAVDDASNPLVFDVLSVDLKLVLPTRFSVLR